jgi:hypothetical protein
MCRSGEGPAAWPQPAPQGQCCWSSFSNVQRAHPLPFAPLPSPAQARHPRAVRPSANLGPAGARLLGRRQRPQDRRLRRPAGRRRRSRWRWRARQLQLERNLGKRQSRLGLHVCLRPGAHAGPRVAVAAVGPRRQRVGPPAGARRRAARGRGRRDPHGRVGRRVALQRDLGERLQRRVHAAPRSARRAVCGRGRPAGRRQRRQRGRRRRGARLLRLAARRRAARQRRLGRRRRGARAPGARGLGLRVQRERAGRQRGAGRRPAVRRDPSVGLGGGAAVQGAIHRWARALRVLAPRVGHLRPARPAGRFTARRAPRGAPRRRSPRSWQAPFERGSPARSRPAPALPPPHEGHVPHAQAGLSSLQPSLPRRRRRAQTPRPSCRPSASRGAPSHQTAWARASSGRRASRLCSPRPPRQTSASASAPTMPRRCTSTTRSRAAPRRGPTPSPCERGGGP